MKFPTLTLALTLTLSFNLAAQTEYIDTEVVQRMAHLEFLQGEWHGSGWMLNYSGEKETFKQTEKVRFLNQNTALLIQGEGRDAHSDSINHLAAALLIWDKTAQEYRMSSALADGKFGVFTAQAQGPGEFSWQMDTLQGHRRFTVRLNAAGQWHEIGEYSRDGVKWMPFFEMTLDRVNSDNH